MMNYESTDEEDAQTSSAIVPTALAVLAIVLGVAGLYFGFDANKRLNSINTSIQDSTTNNAEIGKTVEFYDTRIAELENQILEQAKLINRLRVYISQSEKAIKNLSSELNVNRDQIVKTANQLNEIRAGGAVQTRTVTNSSNEQTIRRSDTSGTSSKPRTSASAGRTYVIVSGDSFSKIANRFGVPLQAILDANPDADPRRLAIGQRIIIPAPAE